MENENSFKRDRHKLPNFEDYELKHFDISVGGRLFPFDCWMDKDNPESYLMHVKRGQRLGSFIEQYVSLVEKMREPLGFIKGIVGSLFAGVVIAFCLTPCGQRRSASHPRLEKSGTFSLASLVPHQYCLSFSRRKATRRVQARLVAWV